MSAPTLQPLSLGVFSGTNLAVKATCESCRHFKKTPAPGHGDKVCLHLGAIPEAPACAKYAVDPLSLGPLPESFLQSLGKASPTLLKKVAALLLEEANRPRAGTKPFVFGMSVFFKAYGGDYVNNYRRGTITAFSGKSAYVLCQTNSAHGPATAKPYTALLPLASLLLPTQWAAKYKILLRKGALRDPDTLRSTKATPKGYVPPETRTIDGDDLVLTARDGFALCDTDDDASPEEMLGG